MSNNISMSPAAPFSHIPANALRPSLLLKAGRRRRRRVQPGHDPALTFDALMLGSLCNRTRPDPTAAAAAAAALPPPSSSAAAAAAAATCSIYVATAGKDTNSGASPAAAKATVAAGIAATRRLGAGAPKLLCVGGGTFYLDAPLELTAADSLLTIQVRP